MMAHKVDRVSRIAFSVLRYATLETCIVRLVFKPISGGPPRTSTVMAPFDLEVHAAGDGHRIVVSGELDLQTAPDLAVAVNAVCRDGTGEIEIDLQGVRFIDSTGVRTLLIAAEEAAVHGIAMQIVPSATRHVMNVFEVTRVADALPWRDLSSD